MARIPALTRQGHKIEILEQAVFHGEFMGKACRITRPDGTVYYGAFKNSPPATVQEMEKTFDTYAELRKWWNAAMSHNHYYTLPGEEGEGYLPVHEPV